MGGNWRIGVSVFFGTLTLMLVLLWVRSYGVADRLHGRIWGKESLIVASRYGRVAVVVFHWHGARNFEWQLVQYPAGDELAFPGYSASQRRWLGFGWLSDPLYHVMRSTQTMPDGTTIHTFGAATAMLQGGGPVIPYWFLVGAAAGISASPWWSAVVRVRGYSLRTMLIATTLICVALGLGVWLAS